MRRSRRFVFTTLLFVHSFGCSDDTTPDAAEASTGDETAGGESSGDETSGGESSGAESSGGDGDAGGDGDGDGDAGGDGDGEPLPDPDLPGPYTTQSVEVSYDVPTTGTTVTIQATYPADTSAGPFPVVLMAHGFQLPPAQYESYCQRLASHGFVALNVDFNAALFDTNHLENMRELLGGIEWASAAPEMAGVADLQRVGTTGHSLGGKLAVHAAAVDPRVLASLTLDPVDSSMNCAPADCPDVTNLLPVDKPIGVIGETLDATGSLQACAPAADNFETFYDAATTPALKVDVLGANHMSFIDDPDSCGLPCSFCNAAQVDQDVVTSLGRAYLVAFFARHLKGLEGYDLYLDGAAAQTRYVDTGLATIVTK